MTHSRPAAPSAAATETVSRRQLLKHLGPGLVLAAASVGAGDMVTSINGATLYGMGLLWAAALGLIVKFCLTEAVGRHYLATGIPIISDLGSRSRFMAVVLFAIFFFIGLLYGGGLSAITALALATLVPGLPVIPVAIVAAIIAASIVLYGRYSRFEAIMKFFIVTKFALMMLLAVVAVTQVDDWSVFASTLRPTLPAGSLIDVLALIGGVGGTAGVIAYGYWMREKGWRDAGVLRLMRLDTAVSYIVIFAFVLATTIVGTVLVYGTGQSVKGTAGLAALADPMGADFGSLARIVFLGTFALVAFSALVGGFNGLAHQLNDSFAALRGKIDDAPGGTAERSVSYRSFVLFLLASALVVVFLGRPVTLLLVYAAVGSMVLPILSVPLLLRLNRRDIAPEFRNGMLSNIVMVGATAMFGALAVVAVMEALSA